VRTPVEKKIGLSGKGLKFGIVVSRFNPRVTEKLLEGAVEGLKECGTEEKHILIFEVPGAFEIPQAAARVIQCRIVDALICLGAVIRGDTPHFDYICSEASRGIMEVGLKTGVPVLFGVLTVDHLKQALRRSEGKDNKGREAALSAVEMASLFRFLDRPIHSVIKPTDPKVGKSDRKIKKR
jgi:6,7-dimethyl-8-ribityllumazine synthase